VLWTNVVDGQKKTAAFLPLIDQRAGSLLNEVKAAYQLAALQRGVPATEPVMTAEEKEAAGLMIEPVAGAGGGRGGGGGRGAGGPSLPQEYNAEFSLLLPKKMTVMQVRDFLSGEFTPIPLADVMAVLKARETGGSIKLVPAPPPAPVRKK
jgi:aminopeptidase YwaD